MIGMDNFILIAVILLILGGAVVYIVKAKKQGVKCIGCPDAKTCGGGQNENTGSGRSCNGMCGHCNRCGGK